MKRGGERDAAAGEADADINSLVAGYLRDLAFVQPTPQQTFGYKRAAAAIFSLERSLIDLRAAGELPKIPGVGPASLRIINEVLAAGVSATAEEAVQRSGRREEIDRRRALRHHFLSRAEVRRVLSDSAYGGPTLADYHGDLQMHSNYSDGGATVGDLASACQARGYVYAAVTDHSHGLAIAGGMSMDEAADQRRAIAAVNEAMEGRFQLLQGIEANIGTDGELDLHADEAAWFELVLAAPHSRLRRVEDQTARLVTALAQPAVRILAHPRGRISSSRAGLVADWDTVFAAAARFGVAVEIDGDPARQDLDYTMARRALASGCLFALDSDAHSTDQLEYAETALAHARLAGVPPDRIINCWPLDRLLAWIAAPRGELVP